MTKQNSLTTLTTLTPSNYYSHETDKQYMSVSLFKNFLKCEAAALAELNDEWKPQSDPTALLVGNYVHSYFESEESHQNFINENQNVMFASRGKTKGQLKAPYQIADKMIATLEHDKLFKAFYMPGDKEVIVTGEIGGYPWKGKIDSLRLKQDFFCDIKTTRDIYQKIWNEETRQKENFVESYGYYYQMAMYTELIRQTFHVDCQPFIFAISKQDPPDIAAIDFNSSNAQEKLDEAMQDILEKQPHIWNLIQGKEQPKRCEHCEYCRLTKHLRDFVHADEL